MEVDYARMEDNRRAAALAGVAVQSTRSRVALAGAADALAVVPMK